ncbi:MAG: hypothetical protein ACYTGF_08470 [Planctomycetota bacterium]|jgi:hypothetical protein
MTGPGAPEAKILRVGFLTLLFVSMCGLGLGLVSMFFVDAGRLSEWVSRGTGMMLVGFVAATGGLATTLVLQQGKLVWLMRVVVMLLVVTALWWLNFIWVVGEGPSDSRLELLARVGGILAILTFALLFVGKLLAIETDRALLLWGRRVVAANVVVFVAAMISLLWGTWWMPYGEVVSVISTSWGLGTLAALGTVWVLVRMQSRKRPTTDSVSPGTRLRLTCPRCAAEQELPAGLVRCGSCRQALLIEVEEPRCECGYLLFRLEGDRCPECGRTIPEAQRWSQAPRAS